MIAAGMRIRDLLPALLPYGHRDGWILMLRAYLDDSGTHGNSPVIVVGGLIGNDAQWDAFETAWRAKLAIPLERRRPLASFSLYDCENAINEFEGYGRAESDLLTAEFRRIIQGSGVIGYGAGIDKAAWDELVTPERRQNMGPAESFCVTHCVRSMLSHAKEHFDGEKLVAVVYDHGRKPILVRRYDDFDWSRDIPEAPEVTSFTYAKVKDVPGLQGADMIATENFWHLKKIILQDSGEMRPHFNAYNQTAKGFGSYMSREIIIKELESRNPDEQSRFQTFLRRRNNGAQSTFEFFSAFVYANAPRGFYEPRGLFFLRYLFASRLLTSASLGLFRHLPASVISCAIGQALSDDALQRAVSAGFIVDAQRNAIVIPEIELSEIAVQMLFRTVLVGATHPALEH